MYETEKNYLFILKQISLKFRHFSNENINFFTNFDGNQYWIIVKIRNNNKNVFIITLYRKYSGFMSTLLKNYEKTI